VEAATQITLGSQVAAKRMSVRDTERLVTRSTREAANPHQSALTQPDKSRDVVRLEEELSDALATRVTIRTGAKGKGQLLIDYSSFDQLEGLIAHLRSRH
jgi:ParB family chromosome partitioning protein